MTNGEHELFPKHIDQQDQLYSLKFSAPSSASVIEARQTNIEKRFTHIIEFKKATPRLQSPRSPRTHPNHEKHSIAD